MRYERDDKGLVLRDGDGAARLRIPLNGTLSLLVDAGIRQGTVGHATVLRHGDDRDVGAEHRRLWAQFQRAAVSIAGHPGSTMGRILAAVGEERPPADVLREMAGDLDLVRIPVSAASDAVLGEVNACLATTGRVTNLRDRLAEFGIDQTPDAPPRPAERVLGAV